MLASTSLLPSDSSFSPPVAKNLAHCALTARVAPDPSSASPSRTGPNGDDGSLPAAFFFFFLLLLLLPLDGVLLEAVNSASLPASFPLLTSRSLVAAELDSSRFRMASSMRPRQASLPPENSIAESRANRPFRSLANTSAPVSSRSLTLSTVPMAAAKCSALLPHSSSASIVLSAPFLRRSSRHACCPLDAAAMSGVILPSLKKSTEAPALMSIAAAPACPRAHANKRGVSRFAFCAFRFFLAPNACCVYTGMSSLRICSEPCAAARCSAVFSVLGARDCSSWWSLCIVPRIFSTAAGSRVWTA